MRLAIVALFLLVSSTSFAQGRPFEFNGFALGSDFAVIENSSRFSCKALSPVADQLCTLRDKANERIAGAPVQTLMLGYNSGKLETMYIAYDEKYFFQVLDALKQEYGEDGIGESEFIQSPSGRRLLNRIYSWRRGSATLEARRYRDSDKVDTSTLTYQRKAKDAPATPAAPSQPRNAETLTFCAKKWPTDFVMQAHCVEQQAKAAEALQGTLNVTANVSTIIRQKCTADWPADLVMRAHCEQSQAEAWRKLNPGN